MHGGDISTLFQGHCQTKLIIYQRVDEGSLQEQTFSKYKDTV
jgi:hypothetical protein